MQLSLRELLCMGRGFKSKTIELSANENNEGEEQWTKRKILKNLAVVCAGVFLFLSASLPASEIQSSLNFQDGLGTYSVAIGAAINLLPSVLLPPYLIRRFGLKKCIVGAISLGTLSHFGNFYPAWFTLIPASILLNMGTMPMWAAKGTYITHIADRYSVLIGTAKQSVTNMFFGIFYSTYYCGYIFGNLLPYYLLQRNGTESQAEICGFEFCDALVSTNSNSSHFSRPPDKQVYLLFGIFAIISATGAVVIIIFLDSLRDPCKTEASWSRALDSLRLFKRWDQTCMSCISFYRGLNRALLVADFTKGYITCTWGMNHVGFIMVSFGVGCGLLSVTLGVLVRWVGRPILFAFAITSNIAIMLTMIFWTPDSERYIVFFALVFLWGASNAVWESQVAALNPALYPDLRDAAYTNYANAEGVATSIGQAISAPLCMMYKIYFNLVILAFASVSYIALELGPLRSAKAAEEQQPHKETPLSEIKQISSSCSSSTGYSSCNSSSFKPIQWQSDIGNSDSIINENPTGQMHS